MKPDGPTYFGNAVFGSLAYDLNCPEPYAEEYAAAPTFPGKTACTRNAFHSSADRTPRMRWDILLAVTLGLAAAALMTLALLVQTRLVAISAASASLESELAAAKTERAKLLAAYEFTFNLKEIEDYAIRELGMQKPHGDQIVYLDAPTSDRTIVFANEKKESFADKASVILSAFGEYFR